MGQQANITLNTVVYAPAGSSAGIAKWVNRSAGVKNGFSILTESVKDPVTGTQVKIDFDLQVPVVATESDTCSCAGSQLRTASAHISVWEAVTCTQAERDDIYLRIVDLVASDAFKAAIKNQEPAYG